MLIPETELLVTATVTSSTVLAVELGEMKDHLRLPRGQTAEDDYLQALIRTAMFRVEEETGRKLMNQKHTVYYDNWSTGDCLAIPSPPLRSVSTTTGLSYTDSTRGTTLLLASSSGWTLDTKAEPGRLCLSYGASWPTVTLFNVNPIAITFTCGYSTIASGVPQPLRTAVKLIVANLYENREEVTVGFGGMRAMILPMGVSSILAPYRIWDWNF